LAQQGFDPFVYSGFRISLSRGYTLYQRGIKVETAHGLEELSHLSPLVNMLITSHEKVWLIYPREIETELAELLSQHNHPLSSLAEHPEGVVSPT
jgi:hypothetical protein